MTPEDRTQVERVALEPCAHCGSADVGIEGIPGCRYVKCYGCGISTDDTSQERAIAAWNTRAALSAPAEPSAALSELCPLDWVDGLKWHELGHKAVLASVQLGGWLSAALDDPKVCDAMKADIREWFSAGEPMEILGQAATHFAALSASSPAVAVGEFVPARIFDDTTKTFRRPSDDEIAALTTTATASVEVGQGEPVAWMYTYAQQHVSHYSAKPPPLISLTVDRWPQHKNWTETPLYAGRDHRLGISTPSGEQGK